jgi:hypothetical protein
MMKYFNVIHFTSVHYDVGCYIHYLWNVWNALLLTCHAASVLIFVISCWCTCVMTCLMWHNYSSDFVRFPRYCFPFGRPEGSLKATLSLLERVRSGMFSCSVDFLFSTKYLWHVIKSSSNLSDSDIVCILCTSKSDGVLSKACSK